MPPYVSSLFRTKLGVFSNTYPYLRLETCINAKYFSIKEMKWRKRCKSQSRRQKRQPILQEKLLVRVSERHVSKRRHMLLKITRYLKYISDEVRALLRPVAVSLNRLKRRDQLELGKTCVTRLVSSTICNLFHLLVM